MYIKLENEFYLKYYDIVKIFNYSKYFNNVFLKKYIEEKFIIDLTKNQTKKKSVVLTENGYYIITKYDKKYIEQYILKK